MLGILVCVAEGTAEAEGIAVPTDVVLTSGELDQVTVGMVVEIVYGKGSREEAELATVRGFIGAVDWDRRQLVVAREGDERTETVAMDRIQTMTVIDASVKALMMAERPRPFSMEDRRVRVLAKVAAGTASGVAFTLISFKVMSSLNDVPSPDERFRGLEFLIIGSVIGSTVGFPLGVTAVDPYDSWSKTLLAGVIPGSIGIGFMLTGDTGKQEAGFWMGSAVPVLLSLIASEQARQPPQASQNSRVFFDLVPTLNGGLSAAATLRF